jgi:hypothetical protein
MKKQLTLGTAAQTCTSQASHASAITTLLGLLLPVKYI